MEQENETRKLFWKSLIRSFDEFEKKIARLESLKQLGSFNIGQIYVMFLKCFFMTKGTM